MSYRLRLFSGDQLLVATDHVTPEEAGRRVAEFPLDDLMESAPDGSSEASVRREVVYLDESGERPGTQDEEDRVFAAMHKRMGELGEEAVLPCPRCGRKRADHAEPLYPVRLTGEGPVYFACLTPVERGELL